jgi:hypothetical protein
MKEIWRHDDISLRRSGRPQSSASGRIPTTPFSHPRGRLTHGSGNVLERRQLQTSSLPGQGKWRAAWCYDSPRCRRPPTPGVSVVTAWRRSPSTPRVRRPRAAASPLRPDRSHAAALWAAGAAARPQVGSRHGTAASGNPATTLRFDPAIADHVARTCWTRGRDATALRSGAATDVCGISHPPIVTVGQLQLRYSRRPHASPRAGSHTLLSWE